MDDSRFDALARGRQAARSRRDAVRLMCGSALAALTAATARPALAAMPPKIVVGPTVTGMSATGATIAWTTDVRATSRVGYGKKGSFDQSARDGPTDRSRSAGPRRRRRQRRTSR